MHYFSSSKPYRVTKESLKSNEQRQSTLSYWLCGPCTYQDALTLVCCKTKSFQCHYLTWLLSKNNVPPVMSRSNTRLSMMHKKLWPMISLITIGLTNESSWFKWLIVFMWFDSKSMCWDLLPLQMLTVNYVNGDSQVVKNVNNNVVNKIHSTVVY